MAILPDPQLRAFRLLRLMSAVNSSSKVGNEPQHVGNEEQHSFGRFVLVLEKFDWTLEETLVRNPVAMRNRDKVATYLRSAAECLAAVAKTGRIHGNVSPASFAMGQGQDLRLHDFDRPTSRGRSAKAARGSSAVLLLLVATSGGGAIGSTQSARRVECDDLVHPAQQGCPGSGRSASR